MTGEQPFRDFDLRVSESVLIPRPETELLVEQAHARALDQDNLSSPVIAMADVEDGGSGNIALSVLSFSHPQVAIA